MVHKKTGDYTKNGLQNLTQNTLMYITNNKKYVMDNAGCPFTVFIIIW